MIRKREDREQRRLIDEFAGELCFEPIDEFMISASTWEHVLSLGVEPKAVFAHQDVLRAHPSTSLYYRGMALFPRKRVSKIAVEVNVRIR